MFNLPPKLARYVKTYSELAFHGRPETIEEAIDYCVDRLILISQECDTRTGKLSRRPRLARSPRR
jgi:hypothetical protein